MNEVHEPLVMFVVTLLVWSLIFLVWVFAVGIV